MACAISEVSLKVSDHLFKESESRRALNTCAQRDGHQEVLEKECKRARVRARDFICGREEALEG